MLMLLINKMSTVLTLSLISSIIYLLFRFIDMKYINKQEMPIKLILKDSFFVFIGVYLADFFVDQISDDSSILTKSVGGSVKTPAFTGDPEF